MSQPTSDLSAAEHDEWTGSLRTNELFEEVSALIWSGKWTRAEYERLEPLIRAADPGGQMYMEYVSLYQPPPDSEP